jgi:DNA replication protein
MSTKPTDDLIRIAAAGGGMYVGANKSTEDLIRIAAAASNSQAKIIVTNAAGKPTDDLIRIAAAGGGCVIFDLVPKPN